ncbi:MAG: AmmeMemoRadiSam system protein B [Acidobacteriota bacterium]
MDFPKLRYVEAFPVEADGEQYICLRDPLNYSNKIVYLPPAAFFIVSLFDGRHSQRQIQESYFRRYGQLLLQEKLGQIIDQLDANLFLESELFRQHQEKLRSEFRQAPNRPAAHAGKCYSAEQGELRRVLETHFSEARAEGSGEPAGPAVPLKALIAPHIDPRAGGLCYGWAYEQLRSEDHDLFVILGTAHAPTRRLFAGTSKDYETPLGTVKTNSEIMDQLKGRLGDGLFEDEYVHKEEHSIEFQAVYLQYLLGARRPFEIVPILCGSFHQILYQGKKACEVDEFKRLTDSLGELLARSSRKVCLIAAADLAHIGLRFGDARAPDELELMRLKDEDSTKLAEAGTGEPDRFWETIARDQDRRRICGFPCIYTMLTLLPTGEGSLLRYAQMDDRATGSAVSYASMAFH